ncbi:MAG: hypothetical protein ACREJG_07815 [Candidatus Rokuibacteriota bacterium]
MADSDPTADLRQALFRLADLLETEGVPYMVVGALAVAMWGRPRATADVDITFLGSADQLEALAGRAEREGFVLDRQWLEWEPLLRDQHRRLTTSAAIIDLMRSRDVHEEAALGRRRFLPVEGRRLPFVGAEDLILMKMKAGRPRDFDDAVSVLAMQRDTLDERYMIDWARRLGVSDELSYLLREG